MKSLITSTTTFGPFSNIEQGEDRWLCDGCAYQFDVIGDATVGEWVEPPPAPVPPTRDEILAQIISLQQKALRALVEDARGTIWLNKYRADITALRAKL